jgi:hypothetical protein
MYIYIYIWIKIRYIYTIGEVRSESIKESFKNLPLFKQNRTRRWIVLCCILRRFTFLLHKNCGSYELPNCAAHLRYTHVTFCV